jgi:hypothetical protein
MFLDNHYQNAYVTRDLNKAVSLFRAQYGIDTFKLFESTIDVRTPAGRGMATMKVALGWVGNLQYELVEPVSGQVDIYRDALSDDAPLRFHHICMRVHDWGHLRTELERRKQPVVLEGGTAGQLQFAYVDARDSLGHYLEYCWMTPERWAGLGGR